MVDKVRPLKIESPSLGGTETDPFPTELDPAEDYASAKGVAIEGLDTHLIDRTGGNLQFTDPTAGVRTLNELRTAVNNSFNNATNGFTATNVQAAIEEALDRALISSRSYLLAEYNGNATGVRYLEFFPGIASLDAPILFPVETICVTIVARTTATDATCTIGFYDIAPVTPVLLYTVTFTAEKSDVSLGTTASPLFTIPANGQLAIKLDSGSINKPHLYIVIGPSGN